MSSAIVVGVRVRPFNAREIRCNSQLVVKMQNNTTFLTQVRQGRVHAEEPPKEFAFDHAFWTHDESQAYASQDVVFRLMGLPIVSNVVQGFNACLFAYGQTGSGKTYSMMGVKSDPGVLPRMNEKLFELLGGASDRNSVEVSFCEIYNETLKDLLTEAKTVLQVRQHPITGIFVQGIVKVKVQNHDEMNALLDRGLNNRAVSSTKMNNTSSRSHAVVLVTVTQEAESGSKRTGKLSVVDLAGSERAESTGAVGATMVEAQSINSSLTVLGMCLSRLADLAEGKKGLHVPFRDSQLTFLLSENLGGNSKTSMLANISPADVNFEETLSTLRFAAVTKKVKTVAVVNESAATRQIRELRSELAGLKERLMELQSTEAATAAEEVIEGNDEPVVAFDSLPSNEQTTIDTNDVVIDWTQPQLVALTALAGEALVTPIQPGKSVLVIDGNTVHFEFNGLIGEVFVTGEVSLNGSPCTTLVKLTHGNRLVVGEKVFRFSFPERSFVRDRLVDEEHSHLLEAYLRLEIERDELTSLAALVNDHLPEAVTLVAPVENESARFQIETRLLDDYPNEPGDSAPISKPRSGSIIDSKKDELIQKLRESLQATSTASDGAVNPDQSVAATVDDEEQDAKALATSLESAMAAELRYHRDVRTLRQWSSAPHGERARKIWNSFTNSPPPFLADTTLGIERVVNSVPIVDARNGNSAIVCVGLSRLFLFWFKKLDGREPLMGAAYLPGAEIATRAMGSEFHLEIFPCAPRDKNHNCREPREAKLTLKLASKSELISWKMWIEETTAPPPPVTILKRKLLAEGAVTCTSIGTDFDPKKLWMPDETALNCVSCKAKFSLFTRRHHCRSCGEIFCDNCLNSKLCGRCRATVSATGVADEPDLPPRVFVSEFAQFQTDHRLANLLFRSLPAKTRELAPDDEVHEIESDQIQDLVSVDLWSSRLGKYSALEILNVERYGDESLLLSLTKKRRLLIRLQTPSTREEVRESILFMLGLRLYTPLRPQTWTERIGVQDDIVLKRQDDACALLKCSSVPWSQIRVWIGVCDDRQLKFQHPLFTFIAIVAPNRDVVVPLLQSHDIVSDCQLDRGFSFVVLCRKRERNDLWDLRPVKSPQGVMGIGLKLGESSILFLASNVVENSSFLIVDDDEQPQELPPPIEGLPQLDDGVDISCFYENLFAIGLNNITECQRECPAVQVRATSFNSRTIGPTFVDGSMSFVRHLCSAAIPESDLEPTPTLSCDPKYELSSDLPFVRVEGRHSIRILSQVGEYVAHRRLFVVAKGVGTAVLPMAQCGLSSRSSSVSLDDVPFVSLGKIVATEKQVILNISY